MTRKQFIAARKALGWSRAELARRLGCAPNTLVQMETAKQQIPDTIADWLNELVRFVASNPPPDWRTYA